jgi:hypothetical protein
MLRTVKDDLGPKVPGVHHILCECGKVYISQTGRYIEARCKEHETCLNETENSEVVEHSVNTGHHIDFNSISMLDRATGYMDCLTKEAIKIRLNTKNFNRDDGFTLSQAWYPVTSMLSNQKAGPGRAVT